MTRRTSKRRTSARRSSRRSSARRSSKRLRSNPQISTRTSQARNARRPSRWLPRYIADTIGVGTKMGFVSIYVQAPDGQPHPSFAADLSSEEARDLARRLVIAADNSDAADAAWRAQ